MSPLWLILIIPLTTLFGFFIDWGELLGSFEGGMDHEKALIDGGFVIRKMRIRKFLKKCFSKNKGE